MDLVALVRVETRRHKNYIWLKFQKSGENLISEFFPPFFSRSETWLDWHV